MTYYAQSENLIRYFTFYCFFFCCKIIFAQNCTVNAGIDETYCLSDNIVLQGTKGGLFLSAVQWSQISGASVTINPPNSLSPQITGFSAGVFRFSISATCEDGTKTSDVVTITVLNSTIANAGPDISLCPGTGNLSGNQPAGGETGTWTIVGANTGSVTINSTTSYNSGFTANYSVGGRTTLRWTITNVNGCTIFDDIIITNFGGSTTVNAGSDRILDGCYTTTTGTNVTGTFCGVGLGGQSGNWSVLRGPNMPSISNPNYYTTSVTGLIAGTYTLIYDVSGPCLNGRDSVRIIVPPPLGLLSPVIASNITLCDRPTTVVITGSTPRYVNDTCRWVQVSGPSAVTINPKNSPSATVSNLIAKGGNVYSFRYYMENAVTGCRNNVSVTISYIDTPYIMAFKDRVLSCDQDSVFLPFVDTGGISYQHTLLSGPFNGVLSRQFNKYVNFYNMQLSGLYTFNVSRQSGNGAGCVNANDEVNVIVSRTPSYSNAGSDQILYCGTDSTEIVGSIPAAGFGTWSQLSGPDLSLIDDSSNNLTKVSKLVAGKYKFRWIINGGQACQPRQDDVNVYISDSVPKYVNAGMDRTICYGGSIRLNGNSPDSNAFGVWHVLPDSGIVFSDSNVFNPFVSGLAKNMVYSFIWKIYNTCGESFDTVQITTDSSLGPMASNAGTDRCLPDTTTRFNLNANTPWPGIGQWVQVSGPSSNILNDSVHNTLVSVNQTGNYVYEWVISRGTCLSNRDTVLITVSQPTSLAYAGIDIDTCSKNAVMNARKPLVGAGRWSLNIGNGDGVIQFPDSANTLISNMTTGTYYYTWTVGNGACARHSDDVVVNIAEPPTTPVVEAGKVWCNPSIISLKANRINNGKSFWSLQGINPNNPTFNSKDSANAVISNLVSGIYHFKWNAVSLFGICPNQSDTRSDTVVLSAYAGGDKNLCNVYNTQLTGTVGSKGFWTKLSGGSVIIDTTGSNSAVAMNMSSSGSPYKFMYNIDSSYGCPGGADSIEIMISDTARKANAGMDLSYCNRDTFYLNANNVLPDSGTWTIYSGPAGAYLSNIHAPDAKLINPGIGNYLLQWTSSNVGCTNSDFVFIRNYDSSIAALAGNDTIVCPPAINLNATLNNVANATWSQLSGPNAALFSSFIDPKTRIANLVQGTYKFLWMIDNGQCPATTDTVQISVPYALPTTAFAGNDTILCNADSMALDANQPLIGKGQWTQISGTAITIQDDTLYNSGINSLTEGLRSMEFKITNGSCFSSDTVTIEVDVTPSDAVTSTDSQYCLYSLVDVSATPPIIGTGKWSILRGAGAIITFPDSAKTSVTGLNAGNYTFLWTVANGICSVKTDSVQISVDSIPTISNAGKDRNTCLDSIRFAGNKPLSGIGTWTLFSGRNATNILNPNADTSSVTGLDSGAYTFIWEIAKGGCKSADTMRVFMTDPQVNDKCETPMIVTDTGGVFYGDMCGAKTYGNEPSTYGYSSCNTLFYRFRTPGLAIKPKVLNINVQTMNSCNNGLRLSLFDSAGCPGLGMQHDTTILLNSTGNVAFENLKSDQAYVLVIDENRSPCAKTGCNLSFNLFGTALPIGLLSFDAIKTGLNQTVSSWEIISSEEFDQYEIWCESNGSKRLIGSVKAKLNAEQTHTYQLFDNDAFWYPATYSLIGIDKSGIRSELAQKTIEEEDRMAMIKVYPNPAKDLFYVELNNMVTRKPRMEMEMTDLTGKSIQLDFNHSANRYEIDCKNWGNGIYYLQIREGERVKTFKLVVIH